MTEKRKRLDLTPSQRCRAVFFAAVRRGLPAVRAGVFFAAREVFFTAVTGLLARDTDRFAPAVVFFAAVFLAADADLPASVRVGFFVAEGDLPARLAPAAPIVTPVPLRADSRIASSTATPCCSSPPSTASGRPSRTAAAKFSNSARSVLVCGKIRTCGR
jgi:hypothetical protein